MTSLTTIRLCKKIAQFIFIVFVLIINTKYVYSQNRKIAIDVGVKYRATPIYLSGYSPFIVYYIDKYIQEDKHLIGMSLSINANFKLRKTFNVLYHFSPRYDIGETKYIYLEPQKTKKKLFFDNAIFLTKYWFKRERKILEYGIGYGYNNLNSKYSFTYYFNETGTSNFKFQSIDLFLSKPIKKININLLVEYVFKHKFPSPSKLIMPSLSIQYKLYK